MTRKRHDPYLEKQIEEATAILRAENDRLKADRAGDQQRLFHYELAIADLAMSIYNKSITDREQLRREMAAVRPRRRCWLYRKLAKAYDQAIERIWRGRND